MHAAIMLFQHYAKFFEHPINIIQPLSLRKGKDDSYILSILLVTSLCITEHNNNKLANTYQVRVSLYVNVPETIKHNIIAENGISKIRMMGEN